MPVDLKYLDTDLATVADRTQPPLLVVAAMMLSLPELLLHSDCSSRLEHDTICSS